MKKEYTVLVIPGDGIGPEVTAGGKEVLEVIAKKHGHNFRFDEALMGHVAIEATGQALPAETLKKAENSDAILFGAIGHPMYDNDPSKTVRPEHGLLEIRSKLGLFSNIRPIRLFDELIGASSLKPEVLHGADIMFFRELTGGIYFGKPRGRSEDGLHAFDTLSYEKYEVQRIAVQAFESAMKRKKILHSVDKANVLASSRLWRETVNEVAKDYPEVSLHHIFIDAAAMMLIKNPKQFDVVVTGNMFGDILTDEASQIAGSMGMLASASVGAKTGIYEPIHGSAPDIAGRGIANPLASVLSAALLLEIAFGMKNEAEEVISAVEKVLAEGWRTADIADLNTPENKKIGTAAMSAKAVAFLG